jgi:RNA polymerase sigma-70 factor (ECF subfamily)
MHEGPAVHAEDAQLIASCLARDGQAQGRLYDRHGPRVRAYFLRSGFSPADADDLCQETFMRVFASLHTFDVRRGSLGGWLTTIAKNVARRRWRKRASEHFDPELAEQTLEASLDQAETPEAREELDAIDDCVRLLPGDLGRLIRLRYVEARTTRGLAEATGLPESTVRLRLAQARAMIQKCLEHKGIGE